MRKAIITIIILLTLNLISIILINVPNKHIMKHSFTKAICDNNNFCQDYEIKCQSNRLVSQNAITGASIQFSEDWKDPRTKEQINRLCS